MSSFEIGGFRIIFDDVNGEAFIERAIKPELIHDYVYEDEDESD